MMNWFMENMGTIIVSMLLIGAVGCIIIRMRKDREQGKCSCGGSCGSCPMGRACHKES